MKLLIVAVIFQLTCCVYAKSQTKELTVLFKQIDKAMQQITSGQFKLNDSYNKVAVGEDSSKRFNSYDFYFKKNILDTLIGYKISSLSNSGLQQLYNGNELLTLTSWNRKLEIAPSANNIQRIKRLKQGDRAFPLFIQINSIFQQAVKYQKQDSWNLYQNKVDYKGQICYRISMPPQIGNNSKILVSYYVSVDKFIPIGQVVIMENIIGNAKEIQTFENWISDFKPNSAIGDKQFNKESLSGYNKETIVDENIKPETIKLLKNGSLSPDWELPLLSGGTLKLSDLRNKIVVLDFWYKACAPCQKQMIDLQQLHDKFDKDKVIFVSVNTIDDPIKAKLALFMKNRALTMTTVYNGNQIEKLYNIYSSPALLIIDQNGKIAFSLDGYSNTLNKDVNNLIENLL